MDINQVLNIIVPILIIGWIAFDLYREDKKASKLDEREYITYLKVTRNVYIVGYTVFLLIAIFSNNFLLFAVFMLIGIIEQIAKWYFNRKYSKL